jgi:hypothetical protein
MILVGGVIPIFTLGFDESLPQICKTFQKHQGQYFNTEKWLCLAHLTHRFFFPLKHSTPASSTELVVGIPLPFSASRDNGPCAYRGAPSPKFRDAT